MGRWKDDDINDNWKFLSNVIKKNQLLTIDNQGLV